MGWREVSFSSGFRHGRTGKAFFMTQGGDTRQKKFAPLNGFLISVISLCGELANWHSPQLQAPLLAGKDRCKLGVWRLIFAWYLISTFPVCTFHSKQFSLVTRSALHTVHTIIMYETKTINFLSIINFHPKTGLSTNDKVYTCHCL